MNYKKNLNHIKNKDISIAVVGLGYVGLPLALRFIKKKIKVFGFDVDVNKINNLKSGKSYIVDIKSNQLKYFKKNNSRISNRMNILKNAQIIFICLPTPLNKQNLPDMSYLQNFYKKMNKIISNGQTIILESTVYPGATSNLIKNFDKKFIVGKDIFIGYSPERENPGDKKFSYTTTPKLISGKTKACLKIVEAIYNLIVKKTYKVLDIESAEMSKLLENTYRAVNISLINEIKIICEKLNLNIYEIINAASSKNFGFTRFDPGPGIGGHCIPIDPIYLSWRSNQVGYNPKFIKVSADLAKKIPFWIVNKMDNFFKKKNQHLKKVLIIGVSYKPNVGDDRESPAFSIMKLLNNRNIKFDYHDKYFKSLRIGRNNKINKRSINLSKANLKKYQSTIIVTNHNYIDYEKLIKFSKVVFDTRAATLKYKKKYNHKLIYC